MGRMVLCAGHVGGSPAVYGGGLARYHRRQASITTWVRQSWRTRIHWAVLDVVREKGGVFVDSVTTAESKCGTLAGEKGVPSLERDVFLDSTTEKAWWRNGCGKRQTLPKAKGLCHIGHVGPEGAC